MDDIRTQLLKQFEAEVQQITDMAGKTNYICPTCKRHIAKSDLKCPVCGQSLSWKKINEVELGVSQGKKAVVEFNIPLDFTRGDCRKCPLSFISKDGNEQIYECPLHGRNDCPIQIK